MNERIKQLAEQANAWYPMGYPSGEGGDAAWENLVIFEKEDLEKFAELIVRECTKVISDGRYSDMACEGNSHRVSYNNGRYGASLDVKKHFGVEE